jgi:hypothetical protein
MTKRLTNVRCVDCGKFIALEDLCASRLEHTPLNEFGPEENDWTCPQCVEKFRKARVCRG